MSLRLGLAACFAVLIVLAGVVFADTGQREAADLGTVRIIARPAASPTTLAAAFRPATPPSAETSSAQDDAILRALRLPAFSRITGRDRVDPRTGLVCGTVASGEGRSARFVYVGVAAMAALDDRGREFASLHRRLCEDRTSGL